MGSERHGATAAACIDFRHLPVPLFHSAIIIHQPVRFVKGAGNFLTFFLDALLFGVALMSIGTLCFELIPDVMLRVFTPDERVIAIGSVGFRFVGVSFIPMVTSLTFPVFFQALGASLKSSLLTVIRTVVLFVPLGFLFSRFGLTWFWMTFPVTELLTSFVGEIFYRKFLTSPYAAQ